QNELEALFGAVTTYIKVIFIAVLGYGDIGYAAVISNHVEIRVCSHEQRLSDDIIFYFLLECAVVDIDDGLVDQAYPIVIPVFKLTGRDGDPCRIKGETDQLLAEVISIGRTVSKHRVYSWHIGIGEVGIIPYQVGVIVVQIVYVKHLIV